MLELLTEFRNDMESSLSWRIEEYISLKNLLKDENKVAVVKTLIVILYAHFEGFFKDCLEGYVKYLNSLNLKIGDFNDFLIAAALSREFSSFEDMNRKCKELTTVPPAEDFLHKFHRRKELSRIFTSRYLEKILRINDNVINTKSNLKYWVFQENFYILGLDDSDFKNYQKNIDRLVNLRNSVAHGSQKEPIEFDKYLKLEENIIELMEELIKYLYRNCFDKSFFHN